MEDNRGSNKLEKVIFTLLRVFGILAIIGGFLGDEFINRYNSVRVGHVVFISPILIIEIIVSIALYNIFIRFLQKRISIAPKRK